MIRNVEATVIVQFTSAIMFSYKYRILAFLSLMFLHKAYSWEETCWNISCPNVHKPAQAEKELGDTAAKTGNLENCLNFMASG